MNPLIRQMVNKRMKTLTVKELVREAREKQMNLTVSEAKKVVQILQREAFDIGNEAQVKRLNEELKKLNPSLYKQARSLLEPYEKYLDYKLD